MNSAYRATRSNAAYQARQEFATCSSTRSARKSAASDRAYLAQSIVPTLHAANHECIQNLRAIASNVCSPSNTGNHSDSLVSRSRQTRQRFYTSLGTLLKPVYVNMRRGARVEFFVCRKILLSGPLSFVKFSVRG